MVAFQFRQIIVNQVLQSLDLDYYQNGWFFYIPEFGVTIFVATNEGNSILMEFREDVDFFLTDGFIMLFGGILESNGIDVTVI